MIKALILFATLSATTIAFAQTSSDLTPIPNSGNSYLPGPGTYAAPFVPLLSTPIVQLPAPALQVGASNATASNIAGAQNVTASTVQHRATPPLVEPRLAGAQISTDVYPRRNDFSETR